MGYVIFLADGEDPITPMLISSGASEWFLDVHTTGLSHDYPVTRLTLSRGTKILSLYNFFTVYLTVRDERLLLIYLFMILEWPFLQNVFPILFRLSNL